MTFDQSFAHENKELEAYVEFESRLHEFVELCRSYVRHQHDIQALPHKIRLQKLLLNDTDNVAVIGDIHGGICDLQSFLLRLRQHHFFRERMKPDGQYAQGSMYDNETDYILRQGKYIVCLGDFVDNGNSSLPVAHLLFALKMIPGNRENVIILNGNHEDYSTYTRPRSGWMPQLIPFVQNEWKIQQRHGPHGPRWVVQSQYRHLVMAKIANYLLQEGVILMDHRTGPYLQAFEYLPSALFVRYKSNTAWVQMCHGGIDHNLVTSINEFLHADTEHYTVPSNTAHSYSNSGLKWSDFDDIYVDMDGEEKSAQCGRHALKVNDWNGACARSNVRDEHQGTIKTYGIKCTLSYLNHTNISTIIRGHEDTVRGFMSIPVHSSTPKPNAGMDITVYVFPVARSQIVDTHNGVQKERSMRSCVRPNEILPLPNPQEIRTNDHAGAHMWQRPSHCTDTNARSYFTHGIGSEEIFEQQYKHCVPNNRCTKFAQGKPFAYKLPSKDHAVVTTSSCSQGLKKAQQAFIIITKRNLHANAHAGKAAQHLARAR